MANQSVTPSAMAVAFNCPHCGVLASQSWYVLYGKQGLRDGLPPAAEQKRRFDKFFADHENKPEALKGFSQVFEKELAGLVSISVGENWHSVSVSNLYLSQCFSCADIAVWVNEKLVFPFLRERPEPNPDLPESVRKDYEEAGTILNLSPRGAAALLRLAIQKLCAELGEKGKTIDDDIASLVQKGLSPLVQKALDAIRVIGNEAVHPGTIDLKDDTETAAKLFKAVNIIAEQMISNPKHVDELYQQLPDEKRTAIERRDAKTRENL